MLLHHYSNADKFVSKVYRDIAHSREKRNRLIPELSKTEKSVVTYENDEHAIESAVACGIGADRIITVCGWADE